MGTGTVTCSVSERGDCGGEGFSTPCENCGGLEATPVRHNKRRCRKSSAPQPSRQRALLYSAAFH